MYMTNVPYKITTSDNHICIARDGRN